MLVLLDCVVAFLVAGFQRIPLWFVAPMCLVTASLHLKHLTCFLELPAVLKRFGRRGAHADIRDSRVPSTSNCKECCTTCAILFALILTPATSFVSLPSFGVWRLQRDQGLGMPAWRRRHHVWTWSRPKAVKLQQLSTS